MGSLLICDLSIVKIIKLLTIYLENLIGREDKTFKVYIMDDALISRRYVHKVWRRVCKQCIQ